MDLWYIAGPVIGGLIAAGLGLGLFFIVRSVDRRDKEKAFRLRLKTFLISYENEIKRNVMVLERELSDEGEFLEPLSTQSRDVMLYTLGEIPLSEASEAMRYVVESYAVFDEANSMLAHIETIMEHNGDARAVFAKRATFISDKLQILNWDLAQIDKISDGIRTGVDESELS